jgi:hypothetical protein
LAANITRGCCTLANYNTAIITAVKSFIVQAPGRKKAAKKVFLSILVVVSLLKIFRRVLATGKITLRHKIMRPPVL